MKVSDRFDVGVTDGTQKLVRTIKLAGTIPENSVFRAAAGNTILPKDAGFVVDAGKFGVEGRDFENTFKVAVEGAKVAGRNLVVLARPEIKITYSWLHNHAQHAHAH